MKRILMTTLLAAMPAAGFAQEVTAPEPLKLGGFLYGGYSSNRADGSEGGVGIGRLTFEGGQQYDAFDLFYRGHLTLRSDYDDLPMINDEPYEFEVGIDMGQGGKLSLTTYPRCGALPNVYPDGDIDEVGNYAVHPRLPPRFRCIGTDINVARADGKSVDANLYLKYTNNFGPVGLEIYADPFLWYDEWWGKDSRSIINSTGPGTGDLPPEAEIQLSYATDYGIGIVGYNNLGDHTFKWIMPVKNTGLTLIFDHQNMDAPGTHITNVAIADWKVENHPWFKGIWAFHIWDTADDNTVIGVNFGQQDWTFGVSWDADGDWAAEGSYQIRDNLTLLAGWDSGFDEYDGFDFNVFPPFMAEPRGSAFEVGLKMTF